MKTFRSKSLIRGLAMILILASTIVAMVLQPGCKHDKDDEIESYGNYGNCKDGFMFSKQSQIDHFQALYPNCTQIEGYVSICDFDLENPEIDITNLEGLNVVTSIGGGLYIYWNDSLPNLKGLDNVTYIGGNLTIHSNSNLSDLSGLTSLTAIGGGLFIADNKALTSLTGLENIEAGSIKGLEIYYNSTLSYCEIQSVCNYLISSTASVEIHDNAPGCDSKAEVQAACDTLSSRRPKIN